MVQQGLLVNRVLHLWDFLQVAQLKAFSLDMNTYTATQSESGAEMSEGKNQKPSAQRANCSEFPFGHSRKKRLNGVRRVDMQIH